MDVASLDPCSLLATSDLADYGTFNGPNPKILGGDNVCQFTRKVASASDPSMIITVGVRKSAGIAAVNDLGGGVLPREVNGRKAMEAPSDSGCTLALDLGPKNRVDVQVLGVEKTQACDAAEKLATASIEPKMPKA